MYKRSIYDTYVLAKQQIHIRSCGKSYASLQTLILLKYQLNTNEKKNTNESIPNETTYIGMTTGVKTIWCLDDHHGKVNTEYAI